MTQKTDKSQITHLINAFLLAVVASTAAAFIIWIVAPFPPVWIAAAPIVALAAATNLLTFREAWLAGSRWLGWPVDDGNRSWFWS